MSWLGTQKDPHPWAGSSGRPGPLPQARKPRAWAWLVWRDDTPPGDLLLHFCPEVAGEAGPLKHRGTVIKCLHACGHRAGVRMCVSVLWSLCGTGSRAVGGSVQVRSVLNPCVFIL